MPPSRTAAAASTQPADKSTSKKSKSSKKVESPSSADSSSSSDSDSDEEEKPKKSKSKSKASSAAAGVDATPDAIRLFNPTSPRHDRMVLHYVSNAVECKHAVSVLSAESIISVDCEGVALSRTGQLCLIQVSTAVHPVTRLFHVFLFDVIALGAKTFTMGLGALLSTPKPTKLFYDVRRDSESLFHQYGIMLAGVCDIQLLEIARRRLRNESINYLPGLARLLSDRFTDLDVDLQRIKDGMSGKYEEEPDLWQKRPLSREQTIYAAIDVVLLHVLLEEITSPQTSTDKPRVKRTDAKEDVEMKDAGAATASSSTNGVADSSAALPSHIIRKATIFVNETTRALIEQYSDIVWAASIRDIDGEPDMWSRRHVPQVFHHPTFPLSLQAECTALLSAKNAAVSAAAADGAKRGGKRKAAAVEEPKPKINPSFAVDVSAAAQSDAKSLAHFVKKGKVPVARNNYSGLAGTLKHLRSQQSAKDGDSSEGRHRNAPASSSTASAAAAGDSTSKSSATGSARQSAARVGSHVADPTAFHPQLTKEILAQQQKQNAKSATKRPAHNINAMF